MNGINNITFNTKDLLKKFTHGLSLNLILKLKGFIYFPILVNFLPKEDIGIIGLVKSLGALLLGIFLLNMPDSSNRILLEAEKDKDSKKLNLTINSINSFITLLFPVAIIILLVTLRLLHYQSLTFQIVTACLVSVLVFKKLSSFVYQVFQRTFLLLSLETFIEVGSFLVVIAMLLMQISKSPYAVLSVYIAFIFMGSAYLFILLRKDFKLEFKIDFSIIKEVMKISLYLLPSSYALVIIQSSAYIIIERYIGLEHLGEYNFAYSISGLVSSLALGISFFWYSSVVYAERAQKVKLIKGISYVIPVVFILTIIFFEFLTKPIVNLVNKEYMPSVVPIQLLVIGFYVNLIIQIFSGILYSLKREFFILIPVVIAAIFSIVLNILFIDDFGIRFAALTTSLAYIIIFVFYFFYVLKFLPELKEYKFYLIYLFIFGISIAYLSLKYFGLWI